MVMKYEEIAETQSQEKNKNNTNPNPSSLPHTRGTSLNIRVKNHKCSGEKYSESIWKPFSAAKQEAGTMK